MTHAPVCVFAFRRPEHTSRTLSALAASPLASKTGLTVFIDGPRDEADSVPVAKVIEIAKSQTGFATLDVIARNENAGLAQSIEEGVSEMMAAHGRAIVVEDDILTSPAFLSYMNLALDRFRDTPDVWHIAGYNEPIAANRELRGAALWRFMSCWGWASWADRWDHFTRDPAELISSFSDEDIHRFNLDGANDFWSQVLANERGDMRTWAVFWYATIFRNSGLCLSPYHSYAQNIGFDGTGTHGVTNDTYLQENLNQDMVPPFPDLIVEDRDALERLREYYMYRPNRLQRLKRKISRFLQKP